MGERASTAIMRPVRTSDNGMDLADWLVQNSHINADLTEFERSQLRLAAAELRRLQQYENGSSTEAPG